MKKILFVNNSLAMGGIETSLLNLIEDIKEEYEIDLLLYNPEGPLLNRLPKSVRIIQPCWALRCLGMSFKDCFNRGSMKQKIFRLIASAWCKLINNSLPLKFALWKQGFVGNYDIAVAYRQNAKKHTFNSGYTNLVDKCVIAERKIAWIHYDPEILNLDEEYNEKFYQNMDNIVCVSQSIKNHFEQLHPCLREKLTYCYNTLNRQKIIDMSKQKQSVEFDPESFVLFSATRLGSEKGIPRALYALEPFFKNSELSIKWYIAGDGSEREAIDRIIKELGLQENVILIGNQVNPYPYIRNANLYMSTSFHEAAPMVYMEAVLLNTPIFSTETASTKELLEGYEYSYICENSESGIYQGFKEVMEKYNDLLLFKPTNRLIENNRCKHIREFRDIVG